VYDSSAYFIRDVTTGREILVFGDVEPDSISLSPRNQQVWAEAAPKIASGKLVAIFLECSYDDSQSVDRLFGHLAPRFIAEEMATLAVEVSAARAALRRERNRSSASGYGSGSEKKRKRQGSDGGALLARRKTSQQLQSQPPSRNPSVTSNPAPPLSRTHTSESVDSPVSPKTVKHSHVSAGGSPIAPETVKQRDSHASAGGSPTTLETPHVVTPTAQLTLQDVEMSMPIPPPVDPEEAGLPPLRGLKVVVIHVKDKLNDGPAAGDVILEQLQAHETEAALGVEYIMSSVGQDLYL
jgi:3',5'-cyclic-nucleotide phosphodiesterase